MLSNNVALPASSSGPISFGAGLDELLADTGRIQRAREEAAQRHSELYRPVPKREAPKGPGECTRSRTVCTSLCTPKDASRGSSCQSIMRLQIGG